jgi:hypothetical protein
MPPQLSSLRKFFEPSSSGCVSLTQKLCVGLAVLVSFGLHLFQSIGPDLAHQGRYRGISYESLKRFRVDLVTQCFAQHFVPKSDSTIEFLKPPREWYPAHASFPASFIRPQNAFHFLDI